MSRLRQPLASPVSTTAVRRPTRIISGGQSGADIGTLIGAHSVGIPTGGTAPLGYRTECGPQPDTLRRFGLVEHASPNYGPRTRCNVEDSDGTVLFGRMTGGSKLTKDICEELDKPYIINPTVDELRAFIVAHDIDVLNGAGNRESTNLGIAVIVANIIAVAFRKEQTHGA